MDKIVKRVAHAQRSASRRTQRATRRQKILSYYRADNTIKVANREIIDNIKDAKKATKEDWELGPLAPQRDLGFNNYGVVTQPIRQDWSNYGQIRYQTKLAEQRCAWAGGAKMLNLAPGDRVVIFEGHDKGKIDTIKTIQPETGSLTLEIHNRAMVKSMLDQPPRSQPMPLSIDSVRLVYPLPDPATGVTKDTIIRQLKAVPPRMESPNMTIERWRYGNKWDRIVPSLNRIIPWPETVAPEFEMTASDTARDQVEERTFYYSLTSSPMPEGVIDELRNKYSKFRTRHEDWYVDAQEAETRAKENRNQKVRDMQTPLEEFNEMQRAIRDVAGEPELSEDMLAKIGKVMAKSKAEVLERSGVSEVESK
ncbi:KOW domain-containing domain-containing [Cordyceps militaris]|uniref:KOW domain-containing domain-containing n=1 Tax=Cordyceps militaris TaxID=73501 RepID=A0A2H4SPN2_CORMI|nr:KOW domain-containing domain-containing [Cordyceps militaris]